MRVAPTTAGLVLVSMSMSAPRKRDGAGRGIAGNDRGPGADRKRTRAVVPRAVGLQVRAQAERARAAVDGRARGHYEVRAGRDVDRRVDHAALDVAQRQAPQAVQKNAAGLVRRADPADD